MRFLDTILDAARMQRQDATTRYRDGRAAGDGIETADVAFYGPMVFGRPLTWTGEEA
ncbi:hypothetical protein GCM10009809_04190 [Isoptericola hypogeus]|uniref:Uncharacterized protein n=1 Tax=Isoptericola hypogeus TaxID=300179 RepID=A0ABN2ISU7_9MICO